MEEMNTRISSMRALLPSLEAALKSFTSSESKFQVIRTINASQISSSSVQNASPQILSNPRTLLILDSSYNPPSRAHLALASSALTSASIVSPIRLLLLFSTQNADKAPSPSSFDHRIAMMILFAEDLQEHLYLSNSMRTQVPIDIGLTTAPYYADKSAAIANEEPLTYPSKPKHVHLIGYDTLTRFLSPKYYSKFNPPLSALSPFFDAGYGLSVLLRPNSSSDNAVTDDTEEEQRAYISALSTGSLEKEGFKSEWSKQIGILEGNDVASVVGISSTAIRKAAKYEDWGIVEKMCTPGVAAWVQEMGLYKDEERLAKPA